MGHVIGLYSQNISIITCLNCKSPIHPIIILLPSSAKGTALPNPLQQKPRNCKAKSQHPECFLLPTPTLYGFDLHPGWASQLTSYSHLIPLHPEATSLPEPNSYPASPSPRLPGEGALLGTTQASLQHLKLSADTREYKLS